MSSPPGRLIRRSLLVWFASTSVSLLLLGCGQNTDDDEQDRAPFAAPDDSDLLFDADTVRAFRLTIPRDNGQPSSWDAINAQADATECVAQERDYYVGDIAVDGATFADVGIRTKGGCGSSRRLDQKASFKVKLDWDAEPGDSMCPDERRYLDRKSFTLNNGVQDNTALREHLTFFFYSHAGVPAPRTAPAQVYVNDEYYGVYQLIESIDRAFLKRWFNTRAGKGMMYEGSYGCDFITGGAAGFQDGTCWEQEFDLDGCSEAPDPEDDLQFNAAGTAAVDPWRLGRELDAAIEAIRAPDAYYPAVTTLIDWDRFLVYWATSVMMYDWDNYVGFQNNFRIYRDPSTELWTFIPWGVDQTWGAGTNWIRGGGGFGGFGGNNDREPAVFDARGDLAALCLSATGKDSDDRTCRERYVQTLWDVIERFEALPWSEIIDAWVSRLTPVMEQPGDRRNYSIEQWRTNIEDLRRYANERSEELRSDLIDEGYADTRR